MAESITPRRRHWFRFSLRTLLALVVVVAAPLAWIAKEWRQSRHEQEIAKILEPKITYFDFSGPFVSWELYSEVEPQGYWRDLARDLLGERVVKAGPPEHDFADLSPLAAFSTLQVLYLGGSQVADLTPLARLNELRQLILTDTKVTDLTPLVKLSKLRILSLVGTHVEDLAPLAGLMSLESLFLSETQVTDLTPLAGLSELQTLWVDHTPVKDLTPLFKLKKLKELDILGSNATKEQIEELQKKLPNCEIRNDYSP